MKKFLLSICMVLVFFLHGIAQDTNKQDSINNSKRQSELKKEESGETQSFHQQFNALKKWGILSMCGMLGIILIVSVVVYKKSKSREDIIEIVLESCRIRKAFAPQKNNQPQNTVKNYQLTERDINVIVDRVLECLKLNERERKPLSQLPESNSPSKVSYKYLKGKTGKTFSRVENTPDDSFFRISNENGDIADIEFYGNEDEALARKIFQEDIFHIQSGSCQNARSVKMITPGKAKRIGEQWSVIKPIKIILT